jgi:hypothetical protein
MFVDVRPTSRLRGDKALDVTASIQPVLEALYEDSVDLSRLRVVCDWIQYRGNFREVIDVRAILPANGTAQGAGTMGPGEEQLEVAIDLRRCPDVALKATAKAAIAQHQGSLEDTRVVLESWRPTSESCIWDFNRLYWQALDVWEQATGRMYESALPGGASDARNTEAVRDLIRDLFTWWDRLAERNALPDELYVLELGVGNGSQAQTWLDAFVAVEAEEGRDYYRRLHYLMCDYSPRVLELARNAVAAHAPRVSSFVLDATRPTTALGFLKYKVFLVYISNVYDNLPTDEVARISGRSYLVETRAYLPVTAAAGIAAGFAMEIGALGSAIEKLPSPRTSAASVTRWSSGARPGTPSAWRSATPRSPGSTSTRSRRGSAASSCGPTSRPAGTSACTSTTGRWPASSTRCRSSIRTDGS